MKRTRKLPIMNEQEIERYWSKVDKSDDGCWEWTGAITSSGYGSFYLRGKSWSAHKISFFLATGKVVKANHCIMHSCDNKTCTKPSHLSEGTIKQNNADAVTRGLRVINKCKANAHFVAVGEPCKVCKKA